MKLLAYVRAEGGDNQAVSDQCSEEAVGYDGMFGAYCTRPAGHEGLHCDGYIEWRLVPESFGRLGKVLSERHECGRE